MTEPFQFKLAHDHTRYQHSHNYAFGHEVESERRTFWVMLLTAAMTIIEIGAGWFYHSIAVFADGWHMSTHIWLWGLVILLIVMQGSMPKTVHTRLAPEKFTPLAVIPAP